MITPRDSREMKKELENRQQQQGQINESNLSPSTLEAFAENKSKVDAGLLPKYIGGTLSNSEVESKAARVLKFSRIIKE